MGCYRYGVYQEMKIAVIDHVGNYGGGSRFLRALLPAIKALGPEIEMTYFGNPASIKRENIYSEFSRAGITVVPLQSVQLSSKGLFNIDISAKWIKYFQQYFRRQLRYFPYILSGEVHREVEKKVRGYDLAFFPWPFFISVPNLTCPLVGIFHDFNFKYYFTAACTFSAQQEERLNKEVPEWLEKSTPIVSTHFMANELAKFYPGYAHKTKVVHLGTNSLMSTIDDKEAQKIISSLGVPSSYILYPTNTAAHKNIGQLLLSLSILRKKGFDIKVVLTGPGTERIRGRSCDIGVELGHVEEDILGLGYVSNLQMDALIQCAAVVVSTSFYEAGNGPGVDAWGLGVPVAMSNIPAFIEHIEVQGVRAEVFDPHNPIDIALKIQTILSNPDKAKSDADYSREALGKTTWEKIARDYLNIFKSILN
jgi:glycosyltransferase involved in cell wall biosynthesis